MKRRFKIVLPPQTTEVEIDVDHEGELSVQEEEDLLERAIAHCSFWSAIIKEIKE